MVKVIISLILVKLFLKSLQNNCKEILIMKKTFFIFLSALIILSFMQGCSSCNLLTAPDTLTSTFTKTFGGSGDDEGRSIIQLSDKTFMIAGKENVPTYGDKGYIAHIDTNGNAIWQKTYSAGTNIFRDLFQTGNDFVAIGNRDGYIYVIKIDSSGNIIWEDNNLGSGNSDLGNAGCLDGSDILVVGVTNSTKGCYVIKLKVGDGSSDSSPTSFVTNTTTIGYDIIKAQDGDYYVAGTATPSTNSQKLEGMLLRLNTSGYVVWSHFYGTTGYEGFYSIKQKANGHFLLSGESASKAYMIETDINGTLLSSHTYGGISYNGAKGASLTMDEGLICAGTTSSPSFGGADLYLVSLESDGTAKWTKNYGTKQNDYGYDAIQCSDYGFAAIGSSAGDIYVIKVDPLGNQEK